MRNERKSCGTAISYAGVDSPAGRLLLAATPQGLCRVDLDLPLDVPATAFQTEVWRCLRRIPAGAARTYSEVAQALGRPGAARAVARASAANTLAVVIPCHRVIRGDGGLGGYRWGLHRKRELLAAEAEVFMRCRR
jgi:O-6-methylguanine DNA methyltransferase